MEVSLQKPVVQRRLSNLIDENKKHHHGLLMMQDITFLQFVHLLLRVGSYFVCPLILKIIVSVYMFEFRDS